MKKLLLCGVVLLVLVGLVCEPTKSVLGWLRGDAFFEGRSTSYWSGQFVSSDPARYETTRKQFETSGEAVVPVLRQLVRRANVLPEQRWAAAEILGKIGAPAHSAADDLLAALSDPDPHVRLVAAAALPKIDVGPDRAVPALAKLLAEPNVPVLRALAEYGEEALPTLDELQKILANKSWPSDVRWNAARTIGKMHAAALPAVPELIRQLQDETATIREHAAEALGDIGPLAKEAIEPLANVLGDTNVKVRRDAVRSLGQIGPAARSVLPAVEKMQSDPEEIVRTAAKNAIAAIGEQ